MEIAAYATLLKFRAGEAVMNYGLMESLRTPMPPHPDGDTEILACPTCGSGESGTHPPCTYRQCGDIECCGSGLSLCSSARHQTQSQRS